MELFQPTAEPPLGHLNKQRRRNCRVACNLLSTCISTHKLQLQVTSYFGSTLLTLGDKPIGMITRFRTPEHEGIRSDVYGQGRSQS